jgi:excisionase family DNA binding protein
MQDDDPPPPPETLLSTTQAAHLLGVHRSSLSLAIRNNVLVPDLVTNGGHYRFSRATLEAYAEHIAHEPLTSNADLLTILPKMLTLPDGKARMCRQTFAVIERRIPDMTAFVVVEPVNAPGGEPAAQITSSLRFPRALLRQFAAAYGRQDMATSRVLASGEPFYCDDVRTQIVPYSGSQRLNRRSPYRAYAVLPLALEGAVFGTLGICSRLPHRFLAEEKEALDKAARSLAIALDCHNAVRGRQLRLMALGRLLDASFAYRSKSVRRRGPHTFQAEELLRRFQEDTVAEEIFVAGVGAGLVPRSEHSHYLARQIVDGSATAADQWSDEHGPLTGVAIAFPHGAASPIALGGVWRGTLDDTAEYSALLSTLAGAYALGSDV